MLPHKAKAKARLASSSFFAPSEREMTLAAPMPKRFDNAAIMINNGMATLIAATAFSFPVRPTNQVSAKLYIIVKILYKITNVKSFAVLLIYICILHIIYICQYDTKKGLPYKG